MLTIEVFYTSPLIMFTVFYTNPLIMFTIMFTTNSYVKYRMLHVMRNADDISRVKTGELHPDVLIADVIIKYNF